MPVKINGLLSAALLCASWLTFAGDACGQELVPLLQSVTQGVAGRRRQSCLRRGRRHADFHLGAAAERLARTA